MNKEDYLDKYFYHSKDNDGNKLFDREICLKAMKDYAIVCCEEQKREIANVVSGGVGTLHELLKKAILETKNVAE